MKLRTGFALLLLGASGLFGGCTETRFAAPLGDNIETCDARWKGLWIDEEEHRRGSASGFYVDAGCQVEMLDQPEPGGPLKRLHVPVNFVHDRGNDYLVVSDVQLKGLVSLPPVHGLEKPPEKSFFFARYRIHGDTLELFDVDTPKVAALVVTDELHGTVDKSHGELHVYVEGDRAQMRELVRRHAIFAAKPTVSLRRSRLDIGDYEKSLLRPPAPAPAPRKKH